MRRDTSRTRLGDVKPRILAVFVMGTGLALCLVNAFYLLHMVDEEESPTTPLSQSTITVESASNSKRKETDHDDSQHGGKERLLKMLQEAGFDHVSPETLGRLPTWDQVVTLYGDSPKIVGLDTCPTFQSTIDPMEGLLGVAGPFNSGTNLLAELLRANCVLEQRHRHDPDSNGIRWQVNWGKHQPPRFRIEHRIDKSIKDNRNMMPVVAVRNPYSWMQSMCRQRYAAHWFHPPGHCPNLIPNSVDRTFLEYAPHYRRRKKFEEYHHRDPWLIDNVENTANFTRDSDVVPLYVRYNLINTTHTSLAHLWNDWYGEYLQADFPRLFVRMEDLVFHARNVTEQVCKCVGGKFNSDFQYITDSAKHGKIHGNDKTTLVDAMIRYGTADKISLTKGMTREDVSYAKTVFRHDLMEMFGYCHPQ
jgi:hypothetical protein